MSKKLCLIGLQFSRLKVIAEAESKQLPCGKFRTRSLCLCECGKEVVVFNNNLGRSTTSCGCFRKENPNALTHGHTTGGKLSREYRAWAHAMSRCYNPKVSTFKYYGERGITVCEHWHSFENFYKDMGPCPPGFQIERKDNNCGYSKDNCVWESRKTQARNRRNNHILTVRGITAPLSALCEKFNIPVGRVQSRLRLGWEPEDAFFKAPQRSRWD